MQRRSKRIQISKQSGARFGCLPRALVIYVLQFFDVIVVASSYRLVCHEFRDAGQERIEIRGGRLLFELAHDYYFGIDFKTINKSRALLFYRASRGAGCKMALLCFGLLRLAAGDPDLLAALKRIAIGGYHYAHLYIAECCNKSQRGGVCDINISPEWMLYFRGVEQSDDNINLFSALSWMQQASNQGNIHAKYRLGVLLYRISTHPIRGCTLNSAVAYSKAKELWVAAAQKGHAQACFRLGRMYRQDTRIGDYQSNNSTCIGWWEKSSNQGYVKAQYELGKLYHCRLDRGRARDATEGFRWLSAAAQEGHVDAMASLGRAYLAGNLVVRDVGLSFSWCMKAAREGHADAMYKVGNAYFKGKSVAKDVSLAFAWYMKAAEEGHRMAQYDVGFFYEKGYVSDISYLQALNWYRMASEQGLLNAVYAVERIEDLLNGTLLGDLLLINQ